MLSTISKRGAALVFSDRSLHLKSKSNWLRCFLTAKFPELPQYGGAIKSYEDLYKFSVENSEQFWSVLAKSRLQWFKPFNQVRSGDFSDKYFDLKWFVDGKLNVSVNCVDRHYLKNPNKVALIWEKDEPNQAEHVTYK
jgi:acetyl-CoA synthetase